MAMELEGRIARKMNVQTGTSARGAWAKQEFIFEYQEGNFPSQVCMNVWGEDKVKELERHQVGDRVKVAFNLSSREYNGRWYTDVRAWRIESVGSPLLTMRPAQLPEVPDIWVPRLRRLLPEDTTTPVLPEVMRLRQAHRCLLPMTCRLRLRMTISRSDFQTMHKRVAPKVFRLLGHFCVPDCQIGSWTSLRFSKCARYLNPRDFSMAAWAANPSPTLPASCESEPRLMTSPPNSL